MKNNKGFTLVELLVTISILGIITALAMPGVRRLTSSNNEKKFKAYEKSVISATKVYVEDKEVDLFPYVSGEENIYLQELEIANLIKDFGDENIKCIPDYVGGPYTGSYILVKKESGKYEYTPKLQCIKDGRTIYDS